MTRKYFGTDGIRGLVGEGVITPEFILKLGWATGRVFEQQGHCKIVIGKDTRISGYMFESALEAGLVAAGANVQLLGPMPTPGIAYLTRTLRANAGIVISASHNPHYDNGIKFFSSEGEKLADEIEQAIEQKMDEPLIVVESSRLGKANRINDAAGRYIEFCKSTISSMIDLSSLKMVVDCAHGSTYHIAPYVFSELGAEVIKIGAEPNGININDGCGATNPQALTEAVLSNNADFGVALDGDGDRLIMVDHLGEVLDGDDILYILAKGRQSNGYSGSSVVGTLMTNLGVEHALNRLGIDLLRSAVGDRHVIQLMNESESILGGEGSGHIICADRTTTGDGIISALQVIEIMMRESTSLNELKSDIQKYPQCMINVKLSGAKKFAMTDDINKAVASIEKVLKGAGRVLLRPSGTEPLVRVMVEGEDVKLVEKLAMDLSKTVESLLDA
ncbi:MAG: phosphoglucosamine mutase [Cycloclasticus pugetii]|jgi:phosphoglucosamine mutase|uniref:Phosphoglucosamine mutase n=2 Tax=Cycloclasticus TaxID=34067 RepID=S5TWI1_9GAMM|nr:MULTISPECIES: phosphoglucosamine mutase [Cycloclasticus]AGS39348.1 Phosphoglucosamine mutase [Cycloclasticus zancles 78-ME]ATI02953.1 phosphoglucosamine mutase [Cycloclasticus sp. PY97N]EPD13706.1 phosphoglucosamine mutase 1 [Cycloclasticus pugetii]MBV1898025.1 phosphoglucosamine mutase [Cycloclasticus sp.]PHR48502.1 MAG: phosphoglucosamine mutase [Cycloclasticus sp.]